MTEKPTAVYDRLAALEKQVAELTSNRDKMVNVLEQLTIQAGRSIDLIAELTEQVKHLMRTAGRWTK